LKSWRGILAIISLALVITAAFFIGGVIGYKQGYSYGYMAPESAAWNVDVLRCFRRGDSESAIQLLETRLDMQIVWHGSVLKSGKSLFDTTRLSDYDKSFMNKVADYRDQYSSKAPNIKTRNTIASILKHYSSGINCLNGMNDVR
jgi:hypothetical protein